MNLHLKHPPAETEWSITKSFVIEHPGKLYSDNLPELRRKIAEIARVSNLKREPKKRIKDLTFRYETDDHDMVTVVQVLFRGYAERNIRFMTLERT